MRKPFEEQRRFGRQDIECIELNLNCRDEIIPILAARKHIYSEADVRNEILALVAADVNRGSRDDCGRAGLDYWQILVLAAVRLGCNLNYDRLEDLAEQHRTLRMMMGIGDWDDDTNFGWRRIRDNVCLLQPGTIEQISHLVVGAGHRLVPAADASAVASLADLATFIERTEHVMGTARRRVIDGETVPNEDKLFSIFEPHTQLYKRGKAGEPVQFGRLVMVYEDAVGFITHRYLLPRDASDRDVVVEQTRIVQQRLGGKIQRASFDRGFHSPENQTDLAKIIAYPCLPKPGAKQSAEQDRNATVQFRQARQSHPGIESAIGALQSGNGLERCRDRSELGFDRYLALGILGRNLHVLGRLVIARQDELCEAAKSLRRPQSAA